MGKISLQMYTMREHTKTEADLGRTLEKLADIGFTTLQYSVPGQFDVNEVRRMFEANGLHNDSVFCPCLSLAERAPDVLRQCELFGTDHVRMDSIPSGLSSTPAGYRMFAHYLNECAAPYRAAGVKLLYHFHAFEFIRFGDTTGIEILLAESDPSVIQIIPDTHWIQSGGRNPVEFLSRYRDRYDYVHTKDFGIGYQGATWEARPIKFAPVGEGNLDWRPILDLCRENGVKSYAIEQDDCYGRDAFDCVRSSFLFLRKMGVEA